MSALHRLGLGSLLPISVQDRNSSPSPYLSPSPEMWISHWTHLFDRYLYWIEYEEPSRQRPAPPTPTIWRSGLDGSNVTRFLTNHLQKPSGIALNFKQERYDQIYIKCGLSVLQSVELEFELPNRVWAAHLSFAEAHLKSALHSNHRWHSAKLRWATLTWLYRIHMDLSLVFGGSCRAFWLFVSKFLGDGRELWMILCHSVNAGWMVGILRKSGDTQTLQTVIKFCLNFLHFKVVGMLKYLLAPIRTCAKPTQGPLVKLSLPNTE